MVPIDPVVEQIEWLRSIGHTDESIAAAAGLPQKTVWDYRHRTWETAHIDRAARVMAVSHVPVPAQAGLLVPAVGAHRRILALTAAGWRHADIGTATGHTDGWSAGMLKYTSIRYENWSAIRDVYEQLSPSLGPSTVTARRAVGHLLPMEWEGYDIDDPRVTPPRTRRRAAASSDREVRETRISSTIELTDMGLSAEQIATRLGISSRQVLRYRQLAAA